MRAVLAALLLFLGSAAVEPQSVILSSELQPFRINKMMVKGLPEIENTRVMIIGRTLSGEEVPLFVAEDGELPRDLDCYLYFDDSIQDVRVEIRSADAVTVALDRFIRHNPYRVAIFTGPGLLLPPLPGYRTTAALDQLQTGDILVFEDPADIGIRKDEVGEFLKRGIHVITTVETVGSYRVPAPDNPDPLRATLLLLESLDQPLLVQTLESRRDDFARFKKRYHDLIAASSFYGIPAAANRSLSFEGARAEDIAAALEQRYLLDRVSPFYRLVLLGFYLPALAVFILLKRPPVRLLLLALLLAGFVGLSCVVPVADKSLQLLLNPAHLEAATMELVRITADEQPPAAVFRLLPSPVVELQFAPTDFEPTMWRLTYGVTRSNRKEVPLGFFSNATSIKFDQLPTIRRRVDGYTVTYTNPLRYWSLHEPD